MNGFHPKDADGQRKPALHVVPPALLIETSKAIKSSPYEPYNWRDNTVTLSVYYSALQRHLLAWWDGEECDAKSGVNHLAHAAANIAILLDALALGNVRDDRARVAGPAPSLLCVSNPADLGMVHGD